MLFLDASGQPNYPPPIAKSTTNYYTLAGMAITDDKWSPSYTGLNDIVTKYFPDPKRRPIELHYSDLIAAIEPYDTLEGLQRKALADEVFTLIRSLNPVLFAIAVNKLEHRYKYKYPEPVPKNALRYMLPRYSKFLQRVHGSGVIIHDSEGTNLRIYLQDFLNQGRKSGVVLQGNPDYDPSVWFRTQNRLEGIVENLFFIDSQYSPMIQLTDFFAYSVFSHFERNMSRRFNEIYDLFDKDNGGVYGLKKVP